jgi:hypothetical protein
VAAGQREYPGHKGGSVTGQETRAVVCLRAAGGAVQRAQAPPVGVGEPLPVQVIGELGELVHDGDLLSCPVVCLWLCPLSPPPRAATMCNREQEKHRMGAQD